MSGIDFLTAIGRGEIPPPPIMQLLGMRPVEVEPGRIVFGLTPAEFHYNPIGSVHGGVISTMCDSAAACAVHTMLPVGVGYTTLELKVNFLRAVSIASGELFCEGTTIQVGGRVALAEARLTDGAGQIYAHATSTCMIFRPEPARA
jgi:uncharacterized protein (TIGR00369 family)